LKHREFVAPITSRIKKDFTSNSLGLDFGSGPESMVSLVLEESGYPVRQYDPFFKNEPELLQQKYDYIICCEVIEHFHNPEREFTLLRALLKPNGILYCMTYIYTPEIDFATWYYKNDFTHVIFYQEETMKWIKTKFGFSSMEIDKRLIIF
jgi:2-polyprenyl-3-methyl-5-hydroxy-6-metoxy-1,4-benzoquinol methylase